MTSGTCGLVGPFQCPLWAHMRRWGCRCPAIGGSREGWVPLSPPAPGRRGLPGRWMPRARVGLPAPRLPDTCGKMPGSQGPMLTSCALGLPGAMWFRACLMGGYQGHCLTPVAEGLHAPARCEDMPASCTMLPGGT